MDWRVCVYDSNEESNKSMLASFMFMFVVALSPDRLHSIDEVHIPTSHDEADLSAA